jgi:hypothetical protein
MSLCLSGEKTFESFSVNGDNRTIFRLSIYYCPGRLCLRWDLSLTVCIALAGPETILVPEALSVGMPRRGSAGLIDQLMRDEDYTRAEMWAEARR